MEPQITPAQSRAARALLNWSSVDLAEASGVSVTSIQRFETGKALLGGLLVALRVALERAGVEFMPGGVRIPPRRKAAA